MERRLIGEQGFRAEEPEVENETVGKWQWPLIEGVITPEKKKQFWERLFTLRSKIRSSVDNKLGKLIPTSEVDVVTDNIIDKIASNIEKFDSKKSSISTWGTLVISNSIKDARRHYLRDYLMKGMPHIKKGGNEDLEQDAPNMDFSKPSDPVEFLDPADNPADKVWKRQNKKKIMEAISLLSEEEQDLISLFYFQELSVKKIAEDWATPEGSVKSKLFRARKKLLAMLENYKKGLI